MSQRPAYYVRELDALTVEIKRLSKRLKELREQKKTTQSRLVNYMNENQLECLGNVTLKSITPKVRPQRKKKKDAERDALTTLRDAGIEEAEIVWQQLKKINIVPPKEDE